MLKSEAQRVAAGLTLSTSAGTTVVSESPARDFEGRLEDIILIELDGYVNVGAFWNCFK